MNLGASDQIARSLATRKKVIGY